MKLCCADWFVPGETYTQKCDFLKKIGFDGIEVFLDETQDLGAIEKDIKIGQERTGVVVSAAVVMGPAFVTTITSTSMVEEKVTLTKKSIDLTASLGSDFTIVVPEYVQQSVVPLVPMTRPSQEEEEYFITYLQKAADYARPLGVHLVVEPINRYENHFYHTVGDAAAICERTGRDNVKTFLDFFHANIEEADITETVHTCKDYIHHVHLADSNRRLPGKGHTNLAPGLKALREVGYDRNITLEIPIEFIVNPEQQLVECRDYVMNLWNSF